MGKLRGVALAALLVLTSCAASPNAEPRVPDPADPSSYKDSYSADEFFIAGVKLGWVGARPTNSQLVEMGIKACQGEQESSDENGKRILQYARAVYCP
jgi:hypothetical protein